MKKLFVLVLATLMLVMPTFAFAAKKKAADTPSEEPFKATAKVYLFRGEGCPHCEEALEYFDSIKDKYDFELITYEVWYNDSNKVIMQKVAEALNVEVGGVPFIVIGKTTFPGYAQSFNADIEAAIKAEGVNGNANDSVAQFAGLAKKDDKKKDSQAAIIVISVLVVAGVVGLIILGRKTAAEE